MFSTKLNEQKKRNNTTPTIHPILQQMKDTAAAKDKHAKYVNVSVFLEL